MSSAAGFDMAAAAPYPHAGVVPDAFLVIGDSRSSPDNTWPATLTTNLNAATASNTPSWIHKNIAVAGSGVRYWIANIDTALAGVYTAPPAYVLFNSGVNDIAQGVGQAEWIADVEYVIDAVHAKWPSAQFYLMRPWWSVAGANADAIAGWIDTVIAARSGYTHLGPDERVWLKGADNGATNTIDGMHYSAAGETEAAAQWQTTLGY